DERRRRPHRQLNKAQSLPNRDGSYTYVVSAVDPGVHNWIDTSGTHEGILTLRWAEFPGGRPGPDLRADSRLVRRGQLRAPRPPGRAAATRVDVTDRTPIASAVRHANDVFRRIDVLVNNAGYGYVSAIEEGDEAEVRAMFETNFWGLLAVTRAVLPQMRERRSGQIIHNSSQAGLMSFPGTAYYSTSKFAVEALSEGLSREVEPFGIKVTAVEAGP